MRYGLEMRRSLVLVVAVACGNESKPTPTAEVVRPPAPPAAVDASVVDAAPAAATIKLPATKITIADLLEHTRAEIAKVLPGGSKYEPGMLYRLGDPNAGTSTAIRIEVNAAGKAALVAVEATDWKSTPANIDAVANWIGAIEGVPTSDSIDVIDPIGHANVEVWLHGERVLADKRWNTGQAIGSYLSKCCSASGHSRGELQTQLLVWPLGGKVCTRSLLAQFKSDVKTELGADLAELGFLQITCDLEEVSISAK